MILPTGDTNRETWDTYTSAWKLATAEEKLSVLGRSTDQACIYRDPLAHTCGHTELVGYMLDFHQQMPGGHFETTHFQSHHGRSIAGWNMRDGSGAIVGDGISYGEYNDTGKLIGMTGFFATPQAQ